MTSIYKRVLCVENVKLEPEHLTTDYNIEILKRLRSKLEGKYTKHGFIKNKTIEIHKILPGSIDLIALNGFCIYVIYFHASVCMPLIGSIIKAKVININRFGILSKAISSSSEDNDDILEIIVPKNSVNIQSDIDVESVNIDNVINIEILGKKVKYNDTKIYCIGRIVKTYVDNNKNESMNTNTEDDDEEYIEDIIPEDEEIILDDNEEDEDEENEDEDEEIEDDLEYEDDVDIDEIEKDD